MTYSTPKLLESLAAERGAERGLVLATIVETEGSTPQVVGSSAIFSSAGLVMGTVGGGLLEARVGSIAGQALVDRKTRLISVRLDADPSDREGAICGGAARVLIDPGVGRDRTVFAKALEGIRKRRPGYMITKIRLSPDEGDVVSTERVWLAVDEPWHLHVDGYASEALAFDDREAPGSPRLYKGENGLTFVEPVKPLPRLVIAGAGHVGKAVARLGKLLDFSVTVIDDRTEFANAENVPEADEIIVGDIGASVGTIAYSADDYFVIVTRGHQKDAEALMAAIGRPAAYVGMIGSKRKIELMRSESLASGLATAEDWAKVHAPIGLEIGSKTVEEIAVSIAAELVQVRSARRGTARP